MTSYEAAADQLVTTESGRVKPRDPLECYVLQEHFLKTFPKKDGDKAGDDKAEGGPAKAERSGEYIVEVLPEDMKPSREEVVRAREERRQAKKQGKKERSGMNKNRPITRIERGSQLCSCLVDVPPGATQPSCTFPNCKMLHDVAAFLQQKPPDIGPSCYVYSTHGYCPRGISCRFSSCHLDGDGRNLRRTGSTAPEEHTSARLPKGVQMELKKRTYDFRLADRVCEASWANINLREQAGQVEREGGEVEVKEEGEVAAVKKVKLENGDAKKNGCSIEEAEQHHKSSDQKAQPKALGPVSDEDLVRLRAGERKVLDWEDKTYLAPLTTVGNLPFRRVCKGLGVDITCGEMAITLPLLQAATPEWALLKRHESEDFFGIQVAGCSPPQMTRLAQLVEERVDCDFVDINMGCPIDLIYKKGMGSGLMSRKRPMEAIVRSMSRILSCPLTVKMRTGIYNDKNIAHDIFPLVEEWGAGAVTIHGRSREQRYTRLADWEYIGRARETTSLPVFGNGDILNYEDYNRQKTSSGVSGVMVARGALIKPWVFTEIKEQRHWDISAQERLDLVRDFCNYGLEHWGSDDKGIETTRRFLLEWLSFTYRYVPHGLLMFPPQRINERAPLFRGRSELESLLGSPDSRDWVAVTEMFLGKVRDDFVFLPKHKANSYS